MPNKTNIGWTDFSTNLVKYRDADGNAVNACVKASEGCRNCYAEALAGRWGRKGTTFTAENMKRLTPFFDEAEAKRVLGSKAIKGKRVFVNDMTDWMGPWVSNEIIDQCLAVFVSRPDVTFQTLTKHADRQREYFNDSSLEDRITELWQGDNLDRQTWNVMLPLDNLHVGISAEDQKNFDKRWPDLRNTRCALRWISFEPLLGQIETQMEWWEDLTEFVWPDWCVIGGESGSGHRTMNLEAFADLVARCHTVGRVFVKQDSGSRPGQQGRIPDELWLKEFPVSA